MSDLLVISCADDDDMNVAVLLGGNHSNGQKIATVESPEWRMAEIHRNDAPVGGSRIFSDERWTAVFAGDLIGQDTVPFAAILDALASGRREAVSRLNGIFAVAAYDRETRRLYAVSDRRSQKPLFYRLDRHGLRLSTSLAVFVRLPDELAFDEEWFWQLLYFNFPVDDATFLKDVKRCPAACVMTFDVDSNELSMEGYAERFAPKYPLLQGQAALKRAAEVFGSRVPAHYHGAESIACALTGGWDGRTLLALAPPDKEVTAYTYGGPGCADLQGAAISAAAAGFNHIDIPFGPAFVRDLPHNALETVFLSGGLQSVLRSTLHYAYKFLTDEGRRFPLTISGISLGTELRGAAQFPDLISMDLAQHFRGNGSLPTPESWAPIIGRDAREFARCISDKLELLRQQFGPLDRPEHHLSYTIYPASAHYFCGELAIADRYTTVRVPAWDSAVIELVHAIENSTLTLSHFVRGTNQVRRQDMLLQAYLLKVYCPALYRVPVRGIHPASLLAGEVPYQAERAYRSIERKISALVRAPKASPLEDWHQWLFTANHEFVSDLLQTSETLVGEFVDPSLIERTLAIKDMRTLGKLLTTEIILRLIKSRWQRFW